MRASVLLALLAAICAAISPAHAVETRVELAPGPSAVSFRAYGLGVFPLDAQFTRFHGWLTYDPANHADCRVALSVDVASMTASSPTFVPHILGPEFLDAARYPTLTFEGACDAAGLDGQLAMHGVTRPLVLSLDWARASLTALGRLQRADWGMTAAPMLAGPTVRIEVSAHLAEARHAGP